MNMMKASEPEMKTNPHNAHITHITFRRFRKWKKIAWNEKNEKCCLCRPLASQTSPFNSIRLRYRSTFLCHPPMWHSGGGIAGIDFLALFLVLCSVLLKIFRNVHFINSANTIFFSLLLLPINTKRNEQEIIIIYP